MKWRVESEKWKVVCFLLLVSIAASCTSHKKLVQPEDHSNYQWMTAKMEIEVGSRDTTINVNHPPLTMSGAVRMRRDSVVWMSVSAILGMESVRALITEDTVVVINRMGQSYLSEPLSTTAKRYRLPSSLQEIQALLLGNGASDHVEILYGPYRAKIRYSDIHWDEPTTFPIKINKNYERMKL
jgi:hypothetical protein